MHRSFDTQNMKCKKEVSFAIMMLTGNAQIWWNALEDSGKALINWHNMQDAIEHKFQTINEEKCAMDQLYNLKQYTSVQDYIAEFSKLAAQVPNLASQEEF